MKNVIISFLAIVFLLNFFQHANAQNVGIGTNSPNGKLHIKASHDTSQLVVDAFSTQTRPLVRLRNAYNGEILRLHADTSFNTFLGFSAGFTNNKMNGWFNTFIGSNSGFYNTTGKYNTALGRASLYQNTYGERNTALGFHTLFSNTSGNYNTAVGSETMDLNQNGSYNTALGYEALKYNIEGYSNTAIGRGALSYNNADYNTAVGAASLSGNTTGTGNAALGYHSLLININGNENTAVGYEALRENRSTGRNTAIGYQALYFLAYSDVSSSVPYENTAVGYQALYNNNPDAFGFGSYNNTALGSQALYNNTTGISNTAVGSDAASSNSTGSYNVALGYGSLGANVSGVNNTTIGWFAGNDGTANHSNTAIGSGAHVASGSNNCVVVGTNAYTNTTGVALLGSVTSAYCGGYNQWTNWSDGRFKTNVQENIKGLGFILRLRPVTYNMNVRGLYTFWGISPYGKNDPLMTAAMKAGTDEDIARKESIRMSGFIAQEVEKAAQDAEYDFDGVVKPAHDKDHYRIAYAEFVVPLVKAVQEQQAIIDELKKEIGELKKKIK